MNLKSELQPCINRINYFKNQLTKQFLEAQTIIDKYSGSEVIRIDCTITDGIYYVWEDYDWQGSKIFYELNDLIEAMKEKGLINE